MWMSGSVYEEEKEIHGLQAKTYDRLATMIMRADNLNRSMNETTK